MSLNHEYLDIISGYLREGNIEEVMKIWKASLGLGTTGQIIRKLIVNNLPHLAEENDFHFHLPTDADIFKSFYKEYEKHIIETCQDYEECAENAIKNDNLALLQKLFYTEENFNIGKLLSVAIEFDKIKSIPVILKESRDRDGHIYEAMHDAIYVGNLAALQILYNDFEGVMGNTEKEVLTRALAENERDVIPLYKYLIEMGVVDSENLKEYILRYSDYIENLGLMLYLEIEPSINWLAKNGNENIIAHYVPKHDDKLQEFLKKVLMYKNATALKYLLNNYQFEEETLREIETSLKRNKHHYSEEDLEILRGLIG